MRFGSFFQNPVTYHEIIFFLFADGMHVTNPGYEVSPPEALNQEHPFASSSPALVYQNNSYQPNRQMGMHTNVANQQYQQMDQTPAGNTYEVNDQKEQLVPKSYI